MKPSAVFEENRDLIRRIVAASGMTNPRLFGSVVHGEDHDGSDLDLLVDPSPSTSLLDLARLQLALEEATGVKVDVRTPNFLHESFREQVLSEAAQV